MTFPRLEWDQPTRRSTVRGWYVRAADHRILVWEAHPAGADDYDEHGIPVASGAAVLVWLGGGEQTQSVHDDIAVARQHGEAVLRMRGWL